MLQEWLKKANTGEYETTSWQVLVNAVEHSAGGGNPRLAGELALKGKSSIETHRSTSYPAG